ncbi:sigma-54-dependent Fis family transcriptional regulator [Lentibacillus sp. CBA3610]|uniref:sigma-54 interaction domain-containing protein n=1 Tax=Lentibacillus sp. CBA3610 TaxID=2518176 RepID=UPI00159578AC|nr:sigma 54-interacting transcriptional regulator [Lentibacillus sp. CBA3610]QKY69638.1 AAA family ATPase [Lentibacillus sp. CBA3610]
MQKASKSNAKKTEELGYIKTDASKKIIYASPDFCHNFSQKETELLGKSIYSIVHSSVKSKSNIIFAAIFGYSCLVKKTFEEPHLVYRMIIRHDNVDPNEIVSFLNSIESKKYKKTSVQQNLYTFEEIIGDSPMMERVKELASKIAINNSTVLLTGESGTGKELFAQAIHQLSPRKNQPFVAVNCVAIPEELFESELFGYESGAFSGAKKEGKPGKLELAHDGTLFLDEISELSYQTQGKLLRVLQEREVERLGGTKTKQVDIRIITATNRNLKALVDEGKFREDLFYRLYVFDLQIPPLRKRPEDIMQLAYSYVDYFNQKLGKEVNYIDSMLEDWFLHYHWPGNVRELKANIERGMLIVEGDTLTLDLLYLSFNEPAADTKKDSIIIESLEDEVRKAEINAIRQVLEETGGDRSLAAQKLKIHVASLYRKIAKYNIK